MTECKFAHFDILLLKKFVVNHPEYDIVFCTLTGSYHLQKTIVVTNQ